MKCYEGDEPRINVTDEFVAKNNFKIDLDAARKIVSDESPITDFFGFSIGVAVDYLPFEEAKKHLIEEKWPELENTWKPITDVYEAAQDFLDYMVFAWMKAMDERGLSASRSVVKLAAWMHILSRPDVADILMDDGLYDPYGRPALRKACEVLGITFPDYL